MNTLSLFPDLSGHAQFAGFILRVVLGLTLAFFAYKKIQGKGQSSGSNSLRYGIAELIVALFLVVGFFTQIAALLNALILILKLGFKAKENKLLTDGVNYYLLLLTIAIALLALGSGMWSVDTLFLL